MSQKNIKNQCCCCGLNFNRQFLKKEEKIEKLRQYKKSLEKEIQGIEEAINEINDE
jgi:hypothetical protein